jgi:uncharacterized membrane protein
MYDEGVVWYVCTIFLFSFFMSFSVITHYYFCALHTIISDVKEPNSRP